MHRPDFKRHIEDAALAEHATAGPISANHSRDHAESVSMPDDQPLCRPRKQPIVAEDELS